MLIIEIKKFESQKLKALYQDENQACSYTALQNIMHFTMLTQTLKLLLQY